MKQIVESLTMNPLMKQVYMKMADIYEAKMPDSLYMNYYDLAKVSDASASVWETFLDLPDITNWINAKISKMTEYHARAALQKLATSNLSANEVSAIKELLSKSKLLQANQTQKPTVILTYIPQKRDPVPIATPS